MQRGLRIPKLLKEAKRAHGIDVPDGPTMTHVELTQKLSREAVILRSKAAQDEPAGTQSRLGRVTRQKPERNARWTQKAPRAGAAGYHLLARFAIHPGSAQRTRSYHHFYPLEARLGCIIRSYASTEGLEIGDCGSYFFYYNASENDWRVYADCY